MQYAILCYLDEAVTSSWTSETAYSIVTRLAVLEDKLKRRGKLVAAATLAAPSATTTLRMDCQPPALTCGPDAQTREQLLSLYIVDCVSQEEAHELGRALGAAYRGGIHEMRPIAHLEQTNRCEGSEHRPDTLPLSSLSPSEL